MKDAAGSSEQCRVGDAVGTSGGRGEGRGVSAAQEADRRERLLRKSVVDRLDVAGLWTKPAAKRLDRTRVDRVRVIEAEARVGIVPTPRSLEIPRLFRRQIGRRKAPVEPKRPDHRHPVRVKGLQPLELNGIRIRHGLASRVARHAGLPLTKCDILPRSGQASTPLADR